MDLCVLNLSVSFHRLTEPSGSIHDGLGKFRFSLFLYSFAYFNELIKTISFLFAIVGNYSIGVKCSWLIDAREHPLTNITSLKKKPKTIRLHLEEFATECSWDHLFIYDGDSVKSPLIAVFR